MKLPIPKRAEPTYEAFYASGEKIGDIAGMLELHRLRVQIAQLKLPRTSCVAYIVFQGKKIRIDSNGTMSDYPEGFYDEYLNLLCELI